MSLLLPAPDYPCIGVRWYPVQVPSIDEILDTPEGEQLIQALARLLQAWWLQQQSSQAGDPAQTAENLRNTE